MKLFCSVAIVFFIGGMAAQAQDRLAAPAVVFGPYEYESKPEGEEFDKFNPMKAPAPGPMMLQKGDRLAIIGDSITEQKQYSRIIETYLTVCYPQLEITARQYGWSGEKTDGLLRRLEQDVLRFEPTVATLSYGMNDARYRPFDWVNGRWYRDHYTAIVRTLKASGARVVVGSPGCAGKIAKWVTTRNGTLAEHNLNLCTLRDIGIEIARDEDVRFADVFWPMYKAQVQTAKEHAGAAKPYEITGADGIHPGWAGHAIMAHAYLRAMGLDGQIAVVEVDMKSGNASVSEGHEIQKGAVESGGPRSVSMTSSRYPFCAEGPIDQDNSIRSGMLLVGFFEDLNRFTLKVGGIETAEADVTWGDQTKSFSAKELSDGLNLAKAFPVNPFSTAFATVDQAVAAKQAYETQQIKSVFHGSEGRGDIEAAVKRTEAERAPLAKAITSSMRPVTHTITITPKR